MHLNKHTNFLLLFFMLILLPFCTTYAINVLPSDAKALLNFKQQADLQNKLHFNTTVSYCKWQGVQCLAAKVVRLVLEGQNLGGNFPPDSLSRLDQLRVLSLKNNSLTGPIPDLSGLVNLKALFLSNNRFTGRFPPSIRTLHRIRTVDLSHNGFTGQLPWWLTQLERLYCFRVEFNRFVGAVPGFNQSTLLVFNVSSNVLSGPVPVTPTLSRFDLSCYAHNPALCGQIVHRECQPQPPFFSSTVPAAAPSAAVAVGQHSAQLNGVEMSKKPSEGGRRNKPALIIGFVTGVFILLVSFLCFAMAVKRQRRDNEMATTMAGDYSAAIDAAAVMRLEEEREEKVKSAQQQQILQGNTNTNTIKEAGTGGRLVFCAGENELYTLEELMRGSAELLGRGSIGTTYKAVLENSLIVCVKRLDSSKITSGGKEVFQQHMEAVGALRHPNLVPLRSYLQAKDDKLLVYDYQPNGSLFSLIHGSRSTRAKPLHWTSCLKIVEDVAQGLSYIHQAWRLVHGNLKASNVLLGCDFEACVTDYCLNVLTESSSMEDDPNLVGYKAPEIRKPNCEATCKSDVYAFGVLLLELLTGKAPCEHPYLTPRDIAQWVRSARDVEDGGMDENRLAMLLEVAIACSMASPDQRPNMWQVLKMLQEIKEVVLMDDTEADPGQEMR